MSKISASSKKIILGSGAMLLVLFISMAVARSRFAELDNINNWNIHTYKVLMETQELRRNSEDMIEAANRAIVSEQFYKPFNERKKVFSESRSALVKRTEDNREQQTRLENLKQQTKEWFKVFNAAVQERRANGVNARVRQLVIDLRGPTRKMRDTIFSISEAEKRLLAQRTESRAALQSTTQNTFLFNMLLGCLFVGATAAGLAFSARQLERSNVDLRNEIEQRHRAERESQILYRHNEQILNSTTEGIVGLNLKGRITFVNPAAAHMTGWDISELIGKSLHDFVHHTRTDGTRYAKDSSPVLASLQDGRVRRVTDEVFWRREGRSFPVEYTVTPLWEAGETASGDTQDVLVGAAVTFRDITERKRSEIALLRLASIVESSKDAILSHTMDGAIVSCNAAAVRMYGYSAREMEGQALAVIFPRSRAEELLFVTQAIERGERIEPYQTTLVRKDGTPLDVAVTFYPVRDAAGNVVGASSNARPIRREAGVPINLPSFPFGANANGNGNGHSNGSLRNAEVPVEATSA
jgi:PAS domain S-box-containing protein